MPWELIDHQADVGLQATGETLETALADGVRGMLTLMVDPESVKLEQVWEVRASGSDPATLFVALLNSVLAARDIHNALFHDIAIDSLDQIGPEWHASCRIFGEPVDLNRHEVDTDVKAATYGGLIGEQTDSGWRLRCLLDL